MDKNEDVMGAENQLSLEDLMIATVPPMTKEELESGISVLARVDLGTVKSEHNINPEDVVNKLEEMDEELHRRDVSPLER